MISEAGLRVLAMFPKETDTFILDTYSSFRFRPDGTMINFSGFYDSEHSKEKKSGTTRIAFIGDSFTWAKDSKNGHFIFQIEDLAGEAGINLETLKMGLPGIGPHEYFGLLKKEAFAYQLDAVIVMFFVGNDIFQAHPDFKTVILLGSPFLALNNPWDIGGSSFYFYTYRLVLYISHIISDRLSGKPPDTTFSKGTFLFIEKKRAIIFESTQGRFMRQCYLAAVNILKKMNNEAKKRGVTFFVVLIPDEIQVNSELREAVLKEYGLNPKDYDFEQPQKILFTQLKESGILVLDLLPSFKYESINKTLFRKQDTHWNKEGNLLAAKQLWNFIYQSNLIKSET